MKVKVTDGYQIVDKDGKVCTSGVVEVSPADGRVYVLSGWASEVKDTPKQKKAPAARNKKQPVADNK